MSRKVLATHIVALFSVLKYSLANTFSSYEANIKDTSLKDKVLSGHVFNSFTGVMFGECSRYCGQSCRCRSFNLDLGGSGLCELNDVDKEEAPLALRVKKGFIHVSFRPLSNNVNPKAAEVCCVENLCQNGGTCLPEVRSGKKSFMCKCKPGLTGKLCERKVLGCHDHLRANESAASGLYKIAISGGQVKTVYCHFDLVKKEVWTFVMSYSFANNAAFKGVSFQVNNPINEDNPSFNGQYRASLTLMTYLKNQTSFWRATCNHETKGDEDDFAQSNFTTMDIMTYGGHSCGTIDTVNLHGTLYSNVKTWVVQDPGRVFAICAAWGVKMCGSAMQVPYNDDGLFNYYRLSVPQHGCVASPQSTTQYWFGEKL